MEKKDYGDKKTELLVKVARMYYEDSMSRRRSRAKLPVPDRMYPDF